MPLLSIRGVAKRFGQAPVLRNVSLEKVFEPPSIIAFPGTAVETTVTSTVAAQSASVHAPQPTVFMSL